MRRRGCCASFSWLDRALVIARSVSDEAIHASTIGEMDCFASLAMTRRGGYRRSLKNSRSSAADTLSPTPE
jgi:hypothetical protein